MSHLNVRRIQVAYKEVYYAVLQLVEGFTSDSGAFNFRTKTLLVEFPPPQGWVFYYL
jgi:uncharacterized membrane protein